MKIEYITHLAPLVILLTITIPHISVAAPDLDLQTVIAGIKHYDAAVQSVSGEFVINRKTTSAQENKAYTLRFDGTEFEEARVRVDTPTSFLAAEIYDGEVQWEIYQQKVERFQVDISETDLEQLMKEKPEVPKSVKEKFKEHKIGFSNNYSIKPYTQRNSFKIIDNKTKQHYKFTYTQERLIVHSLHYEYGMLHENTIDPQLDPRYWMTFVNSLPNNYLITPLWKLLEKYECQLLQTEMLNGEETYIISVKHPSASSLKLWISPEKGFRLVKLERKFHAENPPKSSVLIKGNLYVHERELEYKEYLPDIWFPHKIMYTLTPSLPVESQTKREILSRTTVQAVKCELNIDTSFVYRLDIAGETLVFDHGQGDVRPFSELKQDYE